LRIPFQSFKYNSYIFKICNSFKFVIFYFQMSCFILL
jgi:hypothetical protein